MAAGEALRDEVGLGGQLLLLEVLGGGAVQQDVHRQLLRLVGTAAEKNLFVVQRGGAPRQSGLQAACPRPCAAVILPQQQDVLQLLCQLVEGHLVLGEVCLIVGTVFGTLLLEVLRVPRRVGGGGTIRRRALGKVQAAVFVDAGTQQALRLRQL